MKVETYKNKCFVQLTHPPPTPNRARPQFVRSAEAHAADGTIRGLTSKLKRVKAPERFQQLQYLPLHLRAAVADMYLVT